MNSEITDDIKEDQGFTFTGHIIEVYANAYQDVPYCLITSKDNKRDDVMEVRDAELFEKLRPYMFTKTQIKFKGVVEEEIGIDDDEFYLYIAKSFEVLNHE